jgi:histone deacetylase 1/2
MFHADVPATYWLEALSTTTYTLNRHPCCPRNNDTPYKILHGHDPTYDHLRVFGCLCYPNLTSTAANKLSPRSVACIFIGYPADTKGYRCLDPNSNHVITSGHVYFDEDVFPFRSRAPAAPTPLLPPSEELLPFPLPRPDVPSSCSTAGRSHTGAHRGHPSLVACCCIPTQVNLLVDDDTCHDTDVLAACSTRRCVLT